MRIDAVNGLNYVNYCTFGKRKVHVEGNVSNPSDVSDLAKVPVIVLLAMNPATLNSAISTMPESDNPNRITILAPEAKSTPGAAYVIAPNGEEVEQSEYPYGWIGLKRFRIQKEQHGVTPLYEYDMLFATSVHANGDFNKITDVFICTDFDNPSANPYTPPPKVEALYFHNTGDGKEFYGAKIAGDLCNKEGKKVGFSRQEMRIDNNTAKEILDLIMNRTKWEDATKIKYHVTQSAKLLPTEKY